MHAPIPPPSGRRIGIAREKLHDIEHSFTHSHCDKGKTYLERLSGKSQVEAIREYGDGIVIPVVARCIRSREEWRQQEARM